MKIVQINICSLKANKDLLEIYINKYKIDIILISETWLKDKDNTRISGYKIVKKNRLDGNTVAKTEKNVIIRSDLNARSRMWGNKDKTNRRGKNIENIIKSSNLITINNGEHTHYSQYNGSTSAIDATIISTDLSNNIEWYTKYESVGSDHWPIHININNIKTEENTLINKTNFNKIIKKINILNPNHTFSLEDYETELSDIIKKFTYNVNTNRYKPKHWWNEQIKTLWIDKEKAQKVANKSKLKEHRQIVRQKTA